MPQAPPVRANIPAAVENRPDMAGKLGRKLEDCGSDISLLPCLGILIGLAGWRLLLELPSSRCGVEHHPHRHIAAQHGIGIRNKLRHDGRACSDSGRHLKHALLYHHAQRGFIVASSGDRWAGS